MHKKFDRLISVEEARDLIRKSLYIPIEAEKINLGDSLRRLLISDITAPRNSPVLPRSAMDGYAVVAADIAGASENSPVTLNIEGEVIIGEMPVECEGDRICVKIPTGGNVPANFDTVVPVEYTETDGDTVKFLREFSAGSNIDQSGSDFTEGEVLMQKGRIIRSKDIAVISSIGNSDVDVLRKIKVGVSPTGNELMPAGFIPTAAKIYDSNGWGIKAVLDETNLFAARHYGIIRDNSEEIINSLRKMLSENDIVITTGGTSAGEKDLVYRVLEEMEPGVVFHGINTRPGMPTLLAIVGEKPVISLPGPPVSAMMVLYEIFMPVLFEKMGVRGIPIRINAQLASPAKVSKGRRNLVPVSLSQNGALLASPLPGGSGAVTRLSRAQGYFSYEGDSDTVEEGTTVSVIPFSVMPM